MDMFPMNTVYQFAKVHGLPEFVKQAEIVTAESVRELPPSAFADPRRQLPIHTKAATWCSYLMHALGTVVDNTGVAPGALKKAAQYWAISKECDTIDAAITQMSKFAEPQDSDFAVMVDSDGVQMRLLPIRTANNVKLSAQNLIENVSTLSHEFRKTAAQNILKRAGQLNVALDCHYELEQLMGNGISKVAEIVPHLHLRARMVKNADIRERFTKMANALEKSEELDQSGLYKLAEMIDLADRMSGLHGYYGRGVDHPEAVCFRHSISELMEKSAGLLRLTNGQAVNRDALADMQATKFAALGNDFVSAISGADGLVDIEKAAEILPTLPADDARLFVNSL